MKFKLAFILVLACLSVVRAQEHGQDDCTICPGNTGKLKRSDAPIPPRTKGCANAAFLGFGSLHTDQRFDPCCNRLTQCYLECNVTKTYCDADFFKCMLNVCGINTAANGNNTTSGDIPDTDGTGSFANFTGTSGNLSCRDKAVCHAGYVKGNEWCDKYDDLQHDYCYCRAGYDVPISQPADAIPLPGYTGGNSYCFSDGVTRMASTAALPQSTGAQSFGKAVVLCLVLFIGMAFATHFSTRKEKQ